ncbi:nicotinamide-nucleotide adenylyltransferase [Patescibacteria group bacterium]
MKKPTCLFIGRFQPFHNGHLLVVGGMSKVCDKIIIAIGSSDKSKTPEDPFTAAERRDMIQRSLQAKNIIPVHDVHFIDVPDQEEDEHWTEHVLELAGEVDQVWTGNEWTKKCFKGKIEIKDIKEVPGISATEVRQRIKNGDDWRELVPDEVAASIKAVDGVKRIQDL